MVLIRILYLLAYVYIFWIVDGIFRVKLRMTSSKRRCALLYQRIATPPILFLDFIFRFVYSISGEMFL